MEDDLNGRWPQWKMTSMKDDLNGKRPQWKTTSMEDDLNGRRPQWKTTTMEDNHNRRQRQRKTTSIEDGIRPHWKTTSMEDDLNGRQYQWKTTSRKPYRKQMTSAWLASKSCTELGPAQPQLVSSSSCVVSSCIPGTENLPGAWINTSSAVIFIHLLQHANTSRLINWKALQCHHPLGSQIWT